MNISSLPQKLWKFLCSLKLAIVLASAATLVTMAGSLWMPGNPRVFGLLDQMTLADWFSLVGSQLPGLSWWLVVTGVLITLLGINTLCCFIDWAAHFRARWRKTGEYFIHLGFILILAAYLWGNLTGFRSAGHQIFVGETLPLAALPGYALRLDAFEPVLGDSGRPLDMVSTVTLLKEGEPVVRKVVKTNEPLMYRGVAVLGESFGRSVAGYRFFLPGKGIVPLQAGSNLPVGEGATLEVAAFYPHAVRMNDGRVMSAGGGQLVNPAIEMNLLLSSGAHWRGWYFLREGLPSALEEAGIRLWPVEPVYRTYSILTINRDPGAAVALAGAMAMKAGVLLALFSYYYKRNRGDRPDIV
jgi:hypothetical protein